MDFVAIVVLFLGSAFFARVAIKYIAITPRVGKCFDCGYILDFQSRDRCSECGVAQSPQAAKRQRIKCIAGAWFAGCMFIILTLGTALWYFAPNVMLSYMPDLALIQTDRFYHRGALHNELTRRIAAHSLSASAERRLLKIRLSRLLADESLFVVRPSWPRHILPRIALAAPAIATMAIREPIRISVQLPQTTLVLYDSSMPLLASDINMRWHDPTIELPIMPSVNGTVTAQVKFVWPNGEIVEDCVFKWQMYDKATHILAPHDISLPVQADEWSVQILRTRASGLLVLGVPERIIDDSTAIGLRIDALSQSGMRIELAALWCSPIAARADNKRWYRVSVASEVMSRLSQGVQDGALMHVTISGDPIMALRDMRKTHYWNGTVNITIPIRNTNAAVAR